MSAFAAGLAALFADPNLSVAAIWRAGGLGDGVACRAILSRPDDVVEFSASRARVGTHMAELRISEVPGLAKGDTLEIGGTLWRVQAAPQRDVEALTFSAELVEV